MPPALPAPPTVARFRPNGRETLRMFVTTARFGWAAWRRAGRNNAGIAAAAIAFFGLLGLVPALTAVGMVCGRLADPLDVLTAFAQFSRLLPNQAGQFMLRQLAAVLVGGRVTGLGALASAVALGLYGLVNAAQALVAALNLAYRLEERRGVVRLTLVHIAIAAGFSMAAVGMVLLMLIVGRLNAGDLYLMPGMRLPGLITALGGAARWVVFGAALAVAIVAIAQIYAHGPCRMRGARGHYVWPGAVVAVGMAMAASAGFGIYARHLAHFTATYGPLGGVVPIMLWFQLCGYALLLGAEVNAGLRGA